MHPQVRDLYKRVIHVGREYPGGLNKVRPVWKAALRNPRNCPSCYDPPAKKVQHGDLTNDNYGYASGVNDAVLSFPLSVQCEKEILKAVSRGRYMVREMLGVVQLKKYRAMNQRYGNRL